jgi:AP2 domain.
MKPHPLPSQEYLCECLTYDPATGDLCWKVRPPNHFKKKWISDAWNRTYPGRAAGGINKYGTRWDGTHKSVHITGVGHRYAHHIIWKMQTGEDPSDQIDHIDNNGSNNRWDNLRLSTQADNARNTKGRRRVHFDLPKGAFPQRDGKYQAAITHQGKRIYLGVFNTAAEAHAIYCAKAQELQGEFHNVGKH